MSHRITSIRCFLLFGIVLTVGCAAKPYQLEPTDNSCAIALLAVQNVITSAGIKDAQATPIKGFPLLRADRLSNSYSLDELSSQAAKSAWLTRLLALGLKMEVSRLPLTVIQPSMAELEQCGEQRIHQILQSEALFISLHKQIHVADNSSVLKQSIALFPLTQWPIRRGIAKWHQQTAERYQLATEEWLAEYPVKDYTPVEPSDLESTIPVELWMKHAPHLRVQQNSAADEIGSVVRVADQAAFSQQTPTVYVKPSQTRFDGQLLTQLNYLFWFSARPAESRFDLLAGKWDGILWRVTLDIDGEPLLYDSIHPCGCYHLFYPTARLGLKSNPPKREAALIPQIIEVTHSPLMLWVSSSSHYIERVTPSQQSQGKSYGFKHYDRLRSLQGGHKPAISMFSNQGIVTDSRRFEEVLLWITGIKQPGAMRQWGHHASAFFGRRHFDDPYLIADEFCRIGQQGCLALETAFD